MALSPRSATSVVRLSKRELADLDHNIIGTNYRITVTGVRSHESCRSLRHDIPEKTGKSCAGESAVVSRKLSVIAVLPCPAQNVGRTVSEQQVPAGGFGSYSGATASPTGVFPPC